MTAPDAEHPAIAAVEALEPYLPMRGRRNPLVEHAIAEVQKLIDELRMQKDLASVSDALQLENSDLQDEVARLTPTPEEREAHKLVMDAAGKWCWQECEDWTAKALEIEQARWDRISEDTGNDK